MSLCIYICINWFVYKFPTMSPPTHHNVLWKVQRAFFNNWLCNNDQYYIINTILCMSQEKERERGGESEFNPPHIWTATTKGLQRSWENHEIMRKRPQFINSLFLFVHIVGHLCYHILTTHSPFKIKNTFQMASLRWPQHCKSSRFHYLETATLLPYFKRP